MQAIPLSTILRIVLSDYKPKIMPTKNADH